MSAAPEMRAKRLGIALKLQHQRQLRAIHMPAMSLMLSDPAFDIVLWSYIRTLQGRCLSVADASTAGAVSAHVGLKWLAALEQKGLIYRLSDENTLKSPSINMSPEGRMMMDRYIDAVAG